MLLLFVILVSCSYYCVLLVGPHVLVACALGLVLASLQNAPLRLLHCYASFETLTACAASHRNAGTTRHRASQPLNPSSRASRAIVCCFCFVSCIFLLRFVHFFALVFSGGNAGSVLGGDTEAGGDFA